MRKLDTTVATAPSLPAVGDALGGVLQRLVDGSIRRGADVLKALSLRADAVPRGRPQVMRWQPAPRQQSPTCCACCVTNSRSR